MRASVDAEARRSLLEEGLHGLVVLCRLPAADQQIGFESLDGAQIALAAVPRRQLLGHPELRVWVLGDLRGEPYR